MTYYVIGVMSGSSLDGLDIMHASITYVNRKWEYEINHAEIIPYADTLKVQLKNANKFTVADFLKLHTSFGNYIGQQINDFKERHGLWHKIHFIASHGHTVFHDPFHQTSSQIGDGAAIAAVTGINTITDLRNMDVALGGQGAPIVPIADQLLFSDYQYCLNLGGIANITINKLKKPIAFDISPCNQVSDALANKLGAPYDAEGQFAAKGTIMDATLQKMNSLNYYQLDGPKSLDNNFSQTEILPLLLDKKPENALATFTAHVVEQIVNVVAKYATENESEKILITGGGAFNTFLIQSLEERFKKENLDIELIVPHSELVLYKEALAMALIGVLRWREEDNVLCSVTGAERNSVGGALWLGLS